MAATTATTTATNCEPNAKKKNKENTTTAPTIKSIYTTTDSFRTNNDDRLPMRDQKQTTIPYKMVKFSLYKDLQKRCDYMVLR